MSEECFEVDVPVRIRDVDFMGHVNNAIYATYLEQTREMFYREVLGKSLVDLDTVLASLSIDFEREMRADQTVTVAIVETELGDSSIRMTYEIRANGDRAATASSVQVFVDESGRACPIPSAYRSRFVEALE